VETYLKELSNLAKEVDGEKNVRKQSVLCKEGIKKKFRPKNQNEAKEFDRNFEALEEDFSLPFYFWLFAEVGFIRKIQTYFSEVQKPKYQEDETRRESFEKDCKSFLKRVNRFEALGYISIHSKLSLEGLINHIVLPEIEKKLTKKPYLKKHPQEPMSILTNVIMKAMDEQGWNHLKTAKAIYRLLLLCYPDERIPDVDNIRRTYLRSPNFSL